MVALALQVYIVQTSNLTRKTFSFPLVAAKMQYQQVL